MTENEKGSSVETVTEIMTARVQHAINVLADYQRTIRSGRASETYPEAVQVVIGQLITRLEEVMLEAETYDWDGGDIEGRAVRSLSVAGRAIAAHDPESPAVTLIRTLFNELKGQVAA